MLELRDLARPGADREALVAAGAFVLEGTGDDDVEPS